MAVNNDLLLYIEPNNPPSLNPVIDELTCVMVDAFRKAKSGIANYSYESPYIFNEGGGYKGFHICSCNVCSSNLDYQLENGEITNSLAIHYLAYHREEISKEQLDRVSHLGDGLEIPTVDELSAPKGSQGKTYAEILNHVSSSEPKPLKKSMFGDKRWIVGFNDRGLGHGDFCVMEEDGTIISKVETNFHAEKTAHLIANSCNCHKELMSLCEELRKMASFRFDTHKIKRLEEVEKRLEEIKEGRI